MKKEKGMERGIGEEVGTKMMWGKDRWQEKRWGKNWWRG
jgi:hypothetical protein